MESVERLMKKVLITGASGLLGQWLVKCFAADSNYEVHAVISGRREFSFDEGVVVEKANLLNAADAQELIDRVKPEVLCHLAWALDDSKFTMDEKNVDWLIASLNIMKYFRHADGKVMLFSGSSSEYGQGSKGTSEGEADTVYSLYGAAKKSFEGMAATFCKEAGIKFIGTRIFSVYGPGDDRAGSALPTLMKSLVTGEKFECRAPYNIWDYIYVEDCARAIYELIEHDCNGIYNIGSGEPVMMKDIVTLAAKIAGREDLVSCNMANKRGVSLLGDVTKIENETGFKCQVSLEDGIQRTLDWWKEIL